MKWGGFGRLTVRRLSSFIELRVEAIRRADGGSVGY